MVTVEDKRIKKGTVTFFRTKTLVLSQIWFNWICSLFRVAESVNAFVILFPSYGLLLGLLFGISAFYIGNKVNDMSIMLHDEFNLFRHPSGKTKIGIFEKIAIFFTSACRFVANIIGDYTLYQIFGKRISILKNIAKFAGGYFGLLNALSNVIFSMFVINDYWQQNANESIGDFQHKKGWKASVIMLKVLRTLAAVAENIIVYFLLLPPPYGFIIGLSFGICFAVLNMIKSIAILYREEYANKGSASYHDTWRTSLFMVVTFAFSVISGVNSFINSYISLNLLCVAAFASINASLVVAFSIAYGVCHFISSTLYWGAFSEQMWNSLRQTPDKIPDAPLVAFPIVLHEGISKAHPYAVISEERESLQEEYEFAEDALNVCNK